MRRRASIRALIVHITLAFLRSRQGWWKLLRHRLALTTWETLLPLFRSQSRCIIDAEHSDAFVEPCAQGWVLSRQIRPWRLDFRWIGLQPYIFSRPDLFCRAFHYDLTLFCQHFPLDPPAKNQKFDSWSHGTQGGAWIKVNSIDFLPESSFYP